MRLRITAITICCSGIACLLLASCGSAGSVASPNPAPVRSPGLPASASPELSPSPLGNTTPAPSPVRLELRDVVAVPLDQRYETFGSAPIRFTKAFSWAEGLGGTCGRDNPAFRWLQCGLSDDYLWPSAFTLPPPGESGLAILIDPASSVTIPDGARLPGAWVDVTGHFGDPTAERCQKASVDACRDRFVVTAFQVLDD